MVDNEQGRGGVVVACQGGGSHSAFVAGVLGVLLERRAPEIDALSGTSGGAVCAVGAWSGLVEHSPGRGIERLHAVWDATALKNAWEAWAWDLGLEWIRLIGEFAAPEVSPYRLPPGPIDPNADFRALLDEHIPFDALRDPRPDAPRLLIGAADVLDGQFRVFRSHASGRYGADLITSDVILASAAVPTLFRAPRLCGRIYWDGLFSQNPPIRELPDAARERRGERAVAPPPDELWVIQVTPDCRAREPRSMADIRDRRGELSANVSFHQEVHFIAYLNELIRRYQLRGRTRDGELVDVAGKRLGRIKIRRIGMDPAFAEPLDAESKLERSPAFLSDLIAHGQQQARAFLDRLERRDDAVDRDTALEGRDIWGRWIKDLPACR